MRSMRSARRSPSAASSSTRTQPGSSGTRAREERSNPPSPALETRSSVRAIGAAPLRLSTDLMTGPLRAAASRRFRFRISVDGRREARHELVEREGEAQDTAERERAREGLLQEEVAALPGDVEPSVQGIGADGLEALRENRDPD